MNAPDLETIKKHFKKLHKNWSDEEVERQALETMNKYLLLNKDRLSEAERQDKEEFEKALDRESWNLYFDND
jgi:2-polyprenyl-3-methyl-5-hydroxy-6-metoxy-1,4-benzoquinol methylase